MRTEPTTKQEQKLRAAIADMQSVVDDPDTSADIKNSIKPSLEKAKGLLASLRKSNTANEAKDNDVPERRKVGRPKKEKPATNSVLKKYTGKKLPVEKEIDDLIKHVESNPALKKHYGKSESHNIERDAELKALPPGARTSQSGNEYYESRSNRSDISRRKFPYLEKGGVVPAYFGEGEDIVVFDYQTKAFKNCPQATTQFITAMDEIEKVYDEDGNSGNGGAVYENMRTSLAALAELVDGIFIIEENAVAAPEKHVTNDTMKDVFARLIAFGVYNYKSGMNISQDVLTPHVMVITSEWAEGSNEEYAHGGKVPSDAQNPGYNWRIDRGIQAKPVGWRYTSEGAVRLGVNENTKPTTAHIDKYKDATFIKRGEKYHYLNYETRRDHADAKRGMPYLEEGGILGDPSNDFRFDISSPNFEKGGEVTFDDKVKSIAKELRGSSVPKKYTKEYGKRYGKDDAKTAATKIAGSILAKKYGNKK